jgi:hypothetical protein
MNKLLIAGSVITHKGIIIRASGGFCLLEEQREINLDKLKAAGYTILNFSNGEFILFPLSALPDGIAEGDKIEMTIKTGD